MTDERPVFRFPIHEDDARWLLTNAVLRMDLITHVCDDRTEKTLRLTSDKGDCREFEVNFFLSNPYFRLSPNDVSLICHTPQTTPLIRNLEEIDTWAKENKDEYETYLRLKKKFGGQ